MLDFILERDFLHKEVERAQLPELLSHFLLLLREQIRFLTGHDVGVLRFGERQQHLRTIG